MRGLGPGAGAGGERGGAAPAHREWAARFAAVVADRGFAVLTGDAGVGKSTALRAVWETLSPNQYLPLYLPASDDWTPRQFPQGDGTAGPRHPVDPGHPTGAAAGAGRG